MHMHVVAGRRAPMCQQCADSAVHPAAAERRLHCCLCCCCAQQKFKSMPSMAPQLNKAQLKLPQTRRELRVTGSAALHAHALFHALCLHAQ